MSYPISIKKNDYNINKKNSTILTPEWLCNYIFGIVKNYISEDKRIYDPACNIGNLLKPFKQSGYKTIGTDIEKIESQYIDHFIQTDFLTFEAVFDNVGLIICNPPFNDASGKFRKKLLPELFFKQILHLYGSRIPLILFVPMGFRLNQKIKSQRYKFLRDCGTTITSILSLPIDTFKDVLFHAEVLFFNIPNLDAHYFIENT